MKFGLNSESLHSTKNMTSNPINSMLSNSRPFCSKAHIRTSPSSWPMMSPFPHIKLFYQLVVAILKPCSESDL